ncbi:MAG: 4a-hydroxytetrahydrobiopterin dehydratase [Pseudomonadota bacterium]
MPRDDDSLTEDEIAQALLSLTGWAFAEDRRSIHRSFRFDSFTRAMAFMIACAIEAEKIDHHPDWSNSYRIVDVKLTSHDAKGVTKRDIALAALMDAYAEKEA